MIDAAAGPDRVFLQSAQARRRLARAAMRAPVPSTASTKAAVSVAMPLKRPRKLSAVRSAVSSARVLPITVAIVPPLRPCRRPGRRARSDVWIERLEGGFGEIEPRDHAGLARHDPGFAFRPGRDDGVGGDVAGAAEILFERGGDGVSTRRGGSLSGKGDLALMHGARCGRAPDAGAPRRAPRPPRAAMASASARVRKLRLASRSSGVG